MVRDEIHCESCSLAHSCALLPETCCEEFNVFLDRGVIVGTYEHKKLGFFYEQLYGNKEWGKVQVSEKHERLDRVDSDNRSVYIISGIELGAEEPESIIRGYQTICRYSW